MYTTQELKTDKENKENERISAIVKELQENDNEIEEHESSSSSSSDSESKSEGDDEIEIVKKQKEVMPLDRIVRYLEDWTQMNYGKIIFDTAINPVENKYKGFHDAVVSQSHLLMLFKVNVVEDFYFGAFIDTSISAINEIINDDHSFVFTFRLNDAKKFIVNDESLEIGMKRPVIQIFEEGNDILFTIGKNEIVLSGNHVVTNQEDFTLEDNANTFVYDKENALSGVSETRNIDFKRLVIIQMKEYSLEE